MSAVKGQVVSAITEKTGLGAAQAEQAVPLAKESVTEGIMGAVTGGNVDGVLGMLKSAVGGGGAGAGGGLMQNMVYQGIAGSFVSKLTSKLGLSSGIASTVSSMALPMIMSKLGGAAKAEGDSDEIDASSVMSMLGVGGGAAGMLGKAASMFGGGKKDDDDKDGGGGLLGAIGGMLK